VCRQPPLSTLVLHTGDDRIQLRSPGPDISCRAPQTLSHRAGVHTCDPPSEYSRAYTRGIARGQFFVSGLRHRRHAEKHNHSLQLYNPQSRNLPVRVDHPALSDLQKLTVVGSKCPASAHLAPCIRSSDTSERAALEVSSQFIASVALFTLVLGRRDNTQDEVGGLLWTKSTL